MGTEAAEIAQAEDRVDVATARVRQHRRQRVGVAVDAAEEGDAAHGVWLGEAAGHDHAFRQLEPVSQHTRQAACVSRFAVSVSASVAPSRASGSPARIGQA